MPDEKQKKEAAKWLRRIKQEPLVVQRVKMIRQAALKIRELEIVINKLSEEIDDHEPLRQQLPMVAINQWEHHPREQEVNGFKWWEYAPIELGDDSEAGFLKALAFAFAFSEDGILSDRERHR